MNGRVELKTTAPAGDGDAGSRTAGPLSLIADPTFRKLWLIGVLMGAMRWLEMLAVGVWVYDLTDSPVLVALMTMLRLLPMALFGSVTGVIADRLDRKLLLVLSLCLMAGAAGVLALSAWAGTLTLWQVGLGAFLSGLGWSTDLPVRRTILGESVGHARLGPAMSMDSASNNATRMIGPIAGGGLYAAIGMAGTYAVAAVFYFVAVVLALLVVYRAADKEPRPLALFQEIAEGFAYLRRSRALLGHLGITIIVNLFAFPYASMAPVVGRETFDIDPVRIGLLLTVEGAGAFAGAMLIAFLAFPNRFRRVYLLGSILFVCCILAFSLVTSYTAALLILAVGGFGIAGFASMQSAIMFSEAPPEIRSRLMGILSVCIGAGPLGILHVGWLAALIGGSQALTVIALEGLVAIAVLVWRVPELRR
ncbi:MFS transporter [Nisaea sp.]|uniref:MFS transporter n=1 Tax=Nisaea sp. TaxID=2024842 RepID=UPI002B2661EF|nr:MFS transporter [Nisaea sp.]